MSATDKHADVFQHSRYAVVQPADPAPAIRGAAKPDGDGAFFALREGYELVQLPGALRNAREHVFDDVESFAHWLNRHATDRDRTEILVDQRHITAALDPSDVGGDKVQCLLPLDPRIQGWMAAFAEKRGISQKEFHLLVRAQVGDLEERVAAMMLSAIRDLTITKGEQRQIKLDAVGYVRYAAMSQNREVSGQIPTTFVITVPIFEGIKRWPIEVLGFKVNTGAVQVLEPGSSTSLEPLEDLVEVQPAEWQPALYSIEVLLGMEEDAQTKEVRFMLEAPSLPIILRQARRDAAAYLRSLLSEGFLVGLGKQALVKGPAYSTVAQPSCGATAAETPDATGREAL